MNAWKITSIAVAIIAIAILVLYVRECNKPAQSIAYTGPDSAAIWHSRDNEIASVKATADELDRANLTLRDSLAKIIRSKPKEIRSVVTVTKTIRDTIHGAGADVTRDTTTGEVTSLTEFFEDPYYSAQAVLYSTGQKGELALEIRDTITVVTKEVSEGGLFNRKHYLQIDVLNANKKAHVHGIQSYIIATPKPKRFGIGLIGGAGVSHDDFTKLRGFIGAGLSYNFIRF